MAGASLSVSGYRPQLSPARRRSLPRLIVEATLGGADAGARTGQVTVPMQGTVVKVLVNEGDTIEAGQTVCVLEAMKMENNIVSPFTGTVVAVRVGPGSSVGTGDVVAVVGPPA